jgi:hypothetical protein
VTLLVTAQITATRLLSYISPASGAVNTNTLPDPSIIDTAICCSLYHLFLSSKFVSRKRIENFVALFINSVSPLESVKEIDSIECGEGITTPDLNILTRLCMLTFYPSLAVLYVCWK